MNNGKTWIERQGLDPDVAEWLKDLQEQISLIDNRLNKLTLVVNNILMVLEKTFDEKEK